MMKKFKTFENKQSRVGAGVLPICKKTGRILVAYRGLRVNDPHTWCVFGGRLKEELNETEVECAKRELIEESGFSGNIKLIPSYIYNTSGFEFYNFLGIVDEEFEPVLNWETEKSKWLNFEEFTKLQPKHFGLNSLIENGLEKIKMYSK